MKKEFVIPELNILYMDIKDILMASNEDPDNPDEGMGWA